MVMQKEHRGLYWFRLSVPYIQCEEKVCIILHLSAHSRDYKRVAREKTCPRSWLVGAIDRVRSDGEL